MEDNLRQQQQLYDESWRQGLASGTEQRGNLEKNLEFLLLSGLLNSPRKILEIGCGIGTIVSELSKQGHDIVGTDISNEAVNYGLKKYGDIKLQIGAAEQISYLNDSFDIVLSFDVFEHIKQIDRHLTEVRRVLRSCGYYLFQTPNKYFNAVFETLSAKSLRWRRAHPSLHTAGELKKRLARHGFKVSFIKINPVNEFTLAKLEKFRILKPIVKRINFTRLPLSLQPNLYVVAQKMGNKPNYRT